MKSKEIERIAPTDLSTNAWLKVIAIQIALLVEAVSKPEEPAPSVPEISARRGPGRPRKNPCP